MQADSMNHYNILQKTPAILKSYMIAPVFRMRGAI